MPAHDTVRGRRAFVPGPQRIRCGVWTPSHRGSRSVAPSSASRARNAASTVAGSLCAQTAQMPSPFSASCGRGLHSCPAAQRARCGVWTPRYRGSRSVAPSSASRARNTASAAAGSLRAHTRQTPRPRRTLVGRGEHSCPAPQRARCGVWTPRYRGSRSVAPSSASRARNAASVVAGSCRAHIRQGPCPLSRLSGRGEHSCPAAQRTRCGALLPSHRGSRSVAPSAASRARNAASAAAGSWPAHVRQPEPCPRRTVCGVGEHSCPAPQRIRCGV